MKRKIFLVTILVLLVWVYTAYGEELKLPLGLKVIEQQAFFQDTGLDAVILPDGLERIESEAFAQSSIQEIHLPSSLKYIADNAFQGCGNLSVTAEKGTYAYNWAIQNGWINDSDMSMVFVPETLETGENLTVSVQGPDNSVRHTAFLLCDQPKFAESRSLSSQSGAFTWKGYRLEPGEYRVIVYTVTDEYKTLTPVIKYVQIAGEKTEGPSLSLPETVQYENDFQLNLENESAIKVTWYDLEENQVNQNEWEDVGNKAIWIWNSYIELQNGGYIDISVTDCKDGKWTSWGPVGRVTVTPKSNDQQLDSPILTVPETVFAGQDLEVSFTEVEHASNYFMVLQRSEETGQVDFNYYTTRVEQVTIPGHYLYEGEYILSLNANANEGYRRSSVQKTITVSGQRPPAPEISIDKTEILYQSNDAANLNIHANGAENAAIRRSTANGSFGIQYVNLNDNGSGIYSLRGNSYGEPLCVQLSVSVLIQDTWSEWSAPVEIQIKEQEPLSAPVLTAPTGINNGEDFTFTFEPVEHADYYEARVKPVYGSDTIKSWSSQNCKPGTPLTLEGYNLSRGSYYVTVTAYSNDYTSSSAESRFTVTGTKLAAPKVVCDQEVIHINENVQFALDENPAEAFAVKYEGRSSNNFWSGTRNVAATGNGFIWNWTAPNAATGVSFTFSFAFKQNGLWSGWKTLTYEVQDRPQLDPPVIHAQETYQAGENVTFSFDPVDNAETYYVRLSSSNDNGGSWGNTTTRVFTRYGYDLEPGSYRIVVEARSSEYRANTAEAAFSVEGTKSAAPTVTVDKTEVQYHEKYTFTIDTENAEALRYRTAYPMSGGGSGGTITVLENTTKWTTYSYSEEVMTYQFCVMIDGKWTAWSAPITITSLPKPVLEEPVVMAPASISQGQDLSVTVSGTENAASFRIRLYDAAGQSLLYRTINEPGEITLAGYVLPLGMLKIQVTATISDIQSDSYAYTNVIAGNRPAAPAVIPPEKTTVPRGEHLVFSLETNGAEQAAVRSYPIGNTNNVSYEEINVSENGTTSWGTWWYSDTERIYSFCVKKDGVWSAWSSGIEISPE